MPAPELLIPIKHLRAAKRRLRGILTPDERRALVLAMLDDVLAAGTAASFAVSVLSPDPVVLERAHRGGARPLPEDARARDLNTALRLALDQHFARAPAVLIVLGDTPLVTAAELRTLAAHAEVPAPTGDEGGPAPRGSHVVVAPDHTAQGTNALYLRPPSAIRPRFGPQSLTAHLAAARAQGVPCTRATLAGLALDLDTPFDLSVFLQRPGGTHTHQLLQALRLPDHLARRVRRQRA